MDKDSTGFFLLVWYNETMFSKITKADLVEKIYESTSIEKNEITAIVDEVLVQIRTALESGAIIELRGFGTFEPCLRKGKEKARNPRTGEMCKGSPHYVAKFRAGQLLKNNMLKLPVDK